MTHSVGYLWSFMCLAAAAPRYEQGRVEAHEGYFRATSATGLKNITDCVDFFVFFVNFAPNF
jgi:hypothetical protein